MIENTEYDYIFTFSVDKLVKSKKIILVKGDVDKKKDTL